MVRFAPHASTHHYTTLQQGLRIDSIRPDRLDPQSRASAGTERWRAGHVTFPCVRVGKGHGVFVLMQSRESLPRPESTNGDTEDENDVRSRCRSNGSSTRPPCPATTSRLGEQPSQEVSRSTRTARNIIQRPEPVNRNLRNNPVFLRMAFGKTTIPRRNLRPNQRLVWI